MKNFTPRAKDFVKSTFVWQKSGGHGPPANFVGGPAHGTSMFPIYGCVYLNRLIDL